jgi:B12-binding domain/radical SAM domain protein
MSVRVISPGLYTYGALLIGGIIRGGGYPVKISRQLAAEPGETVFLSLFSTGHLLDPAVRAFVRRHREDGGRCYIGGPVSSAPEMVLGELGPDAVVVGEGEHAVLPLLENGTSPDVPGIAYSDGPRVVATPPSPPPTLERPPLLIPDDIGSQDVRGANIYIETHRGCIGTCTFCQVPRFFGHAIRSRSIEDVVREVEALKKKGVGRISISGGTGSLYRSRDGTMDPDAFAELLQSIAGVMGPRNVSAPDIRADCLSPEVLEAIRDFTIGWIFFGVESGSDRMLRVMGKGMTASILEEGIRTCREYGLQVAGSFIVGHPMEGAEDYQATRDFVAEQCLDDLFVSIAEPIPGTPLARQTLAVDEALNPTYRPDEGEYRALGLTVSEGRCFDLLLHGDLFKPKFRVVTDQIYDAYLAEARRQGREIRAVTGLLRRYESCV